MSIGSLVGDRVETLARAAPRPSEAAVDTYRAFIDRHLDEAYRLATFILGDRSDAEDAVHDAAISAWRHWPERRDTARSEAWFRRIVVNASRDQTRARRRVRALDVGLRSDPAARQFVEAVDASIGTRDEVARALDRLDSGSRVLLGLRFGLDLTVPSIAAALGLREGTVKSRLHRALRDVRVAIEEQRR
jgi:RNA polymerase sigma-70 factor (ECF subfamily)